MLYFEPGDCTPVHYDQSPETFLVIDGKCAVKGIKGEERVIEKNDIVFFLAKDYYHLIKVGTLSANISETLTCLEFSVE